MAVIGARIPTEGHFCEAWGGAKRGGRLTFLAAMAVIGASAENTLRP